MYNSRQKIILEIINSAPVKDQRELMQALQDRGVSAAQATVSRDIRKLNLKKVKETAADGTVISRYMAFTKKETNDSAYNKFCSLYEKSLVSAVAARNILVIKTHIGMAQAVCAAFDSCNNENVVGSLAGDDTIFIVCRTDEDALALIESLNKISEM